MIEKLNTEQLAAANLAFVGVSARKAANPEEYDLISGTRSTLNDFIESFQNFSGDYDTVQSFGDAGILWRELATS